MHAASRSTIVGVEQRSSGFELFDGDGIRSIPESQGKTSGVCKPGSRPRHLFLTTMAAHVGSPAGKVMSRGSPAPRPIRWSCSQACKSIDPSCGFPPEPRPSRAGVGRVSSTRPSTRPLVQYSAACCGTRTASSASTDRYKRVLRAIIKTPTFAPQGARRSGAPLMVDRALTEAI